VWNVQHNLNTPQPAGVLTLDDTGEAFFCEADFPASTPNLLVLRLGAAVSGSAVITA
jgi:hypothetical protein